MDYFDAQHLLLYVLAEYKYLCRLIYGMNKALNLALGHGGRRGAALALMPFLLSGSGRQMYFTVRYLGVVYSQVEVDR